MLSRGVNVLELCSARGMELGGMDL